VVQNHWPAYKSISRRWLLRTCTGCKLRSTEAYYCVHGPLSTASSWTLKPLDARRGRRAVASSTWPLMRNWHHSSVTQLSYVIRQWTSNNRTLSRGATRRKLRISSARKKFFILWRAYKSPPPELLRQDFVVNFATYTRVYTVIIEIHFMFMFLFVIMSRQWLQEKSCGWATRSIIISLCSLWQ